MATVDLESVEQMQTKREYQLYSFDIFDTLITRKTATPKGIFAIMQEKLRSNKQFQTLPSNLIQNFFILRAQIEQYIKANRRLEGLNEITIDEIYDFIAQNYYLSEEEKVSLLRLEIETEKENLIPIPERIEKLKTLVNEGQKVILLSDMYLTTNYLKEILEHIDPIFKKVSIYSSANTRKPKQNGSAYTYIREMENINYAKWIHTGDNPVADIQRAKNYGIKTEQVYAPALKDYEKAILRNNEDDVFVQLTVGAAKNTRLFTKNRTPQKELGISLGAPILFSYIAWLVEQAQRRGLTRLYFIARDGFILKKMTDKLIKAKNLAIKTFYIYGSREAWRLPSLCGENFDVATYVFNEKWYISNTEGLAERFSLQPEEFNKFLPEKYKTFKKQLTTPDIEIIKNHLMNNSEFKDLILKKNNQRREILIKYIKQEFDFSDDNFAIVDLQGSGLTQQSLASLINATIYPKPIKCFYSRIAKNQITENEKFTEILVEFPNRNYLHFIRELFCRALHGQTIDYIEGNNKIVPNIKETSPALERWGYQDFIDGACEFTDNYITATNKTTLTLSDLTVFINYYNYIINTPNKEISELLGSIPFSYVGQNDDNSECAPPYTIKDVLDYPNQRRTVHKYSMQRSPKHIQQLMNYKIQYTNNKKKAKAKKKFNLTKWFLSAQINKKKRIAFIKICGVQISFRKLLWRQH